MECDVIVNILLKELEHHLDFHLPKGEVERVIREIRKVIDNAGQKEPGLNSL